MFALSLAVLDVGNGSFSVDNMSVADVQIATHSPAP